MGSAFQDIGGGGGGDDGGDDGELDDEESGHYNCAKCPATIDGNCPRGWCDPLWVARAHGWLPNRKKWSYCPTCVHQAGVFYRNKSRKLMQQAKDDDRLCADCTP